MIAWCFFTEVFQVMYMRCDRKPHFGIFYIWEAKILAGFLNDLADSRIMHMRYAGK